jgi:pilus assembly protein Flp/PilA
MSRRRSKGTMKKAAKSSRGFHILLTPGRQNARMLAVCMPAGPSIEGRDGHDFGEVCFMGIFLSRFFAEEDGTTSIEYALVACGIAVAVVAAINALGQTVLATQFGAIAAAFNQ